MKSGRLFIASSICALAISQPALSQSSDAPPQDSGRAGGGIEEIIVTAQKRAENVQDVPIAISTFTSSALRERAVAESRASRTWRPT